MKSHVQQICCLFLGIAIIMSTAGCAWVAEVIAANAGDDEFDHIEDDRTRFEAEFIRNRDRERQLEELKRRFPPRPEQDLLFDTTFE